MKKCQHCGAENSNERIVCENCDHYLPTPKLEPQSLKVQEPKEQSPEYVQLYYGPKVKKSTYEWMQQKDRNAGIFVLGWILLFLLCVLFSR